MRTRTSTDVRRVDADVCIPSHQAFQRLADPSTCFLQKICQRLASHCDLMSASDTSSVYSGDTPFDLDEWRRNFKQSGLNKRKYFL